MVPVSYSEQNMFTFDFEEEETIYNKTLSDKLDAIEDFINQLEEAEENQEWIMTWEEYNETPDF